MKSQMRVSFVGFSMLFVVLFAARFVIDGWARSAIADDVQVQNHQGVDVSWSDMKQNYASTKMNRRDGGSGALTVDQKYERVATIHSTTERFDVEERNLRDAIKAHGGLIQFEQNHGLPGARNLRLAIGAPPDRFDAMVEEARKLGTVRQIQVNKKDKTNEYRDLQAQRASLEKARASLSELKSRAGRIEELVSLETRILELEEKLQGLGVKLGEYDAENEFCTVLVSLQEKQGTKPRTMAVRAFSALRWTIPVYVGILATLAGVLFVAWLTVVVLEKTRVLKPAK